MIARKLPLALGMAASVAASAAQAGTTLYEGEDGLKFAFGMTSEFVFRSMENLDFNDDVRNGFQFATPRPGTSDVFGSGALSSVSGLVSDDEPGQMVAENRLFFTMSKDLLEVYTVLEWDGTLDRRSIDDNDPNLERARVTYTVPTWDSKLNFGADLVFVDTVGRLVYVDDDPGAWISGGSHGANWFLGYHKRRENSGAAGDSASRFGEVGNGRDHDVFSARLGLAGGGGASTWYVEPFVIGQQRHDEEFDATGSVSENTEMFAAYFGTGARYRLGGLTIEGEVVTHQGKVDGTGVVTNRDGFDQSYDELDISSYAAYLRVAFANAVGGLTPYASWDWASGDSDPYDDTLTGYVPIGSSNDLRADNIASMRKSIVNLMPNAVGNNAVEFGFETINLGVGPSIGGLTGNGFGANPGFHRLQTGLQGSLTSKLGLYTRAVYLRFAQAEAATAGAQARGQTVSEVDEDIGWGFDLQLPYKAQPQFAVTPFVSIFEPGDGAEALAGNDDTAYMGGVQIKAGF